MKPKSTSPSNQFTLSTREYTILRAYIMGLSELAIMQLLHCSKQELYIQLYKLHDKLNVENTYMAVTKALHLGLISEENYQPEFIKEATLAYLDAFGVEQANELRETNQRWKTYQYLLKYQTFLNNYKLKKKSHRGGIKDF